jgi:nucleoside-diphosphate-sugar epimerase
MTGKVLVAGALGIVGRAAMAQFAAEGREAIGLSRRAPPEGLPGRYIAVDLTDSADCREKLSGIGEVSHLVYAALFEKPDLKAGWTETDQIATNGAMLRNLLDALEGKGLRHVTLLQGAKAYGGHLGQGPVPARERSPRHMHPNFYWVQEDTLRARSGEGGWSWTVFRPQVILGHAPGSAMNVVAAIGAYAAIARALGQPLSYPGTGERITEATDVRLLAEAISWAGETEAARAEIFNITNGDVLLWQQLWPVVAECFGMAMGLAQPMPLATVMPPLEEVWQGIVREHGLSPSTLAGLVGSSWQFLDFTVSRTYATSSLLSTIKLRQAGFGGCIDSEDSLRWHLRDLQRQRVLPE